MTGQGWSSFLVFHNNNHHKSLTCHVSELCPHFSGNQGRIDLRPCMFGGSRHVECKTVRDIYQRPVTMSSKE